MQICLVGLSHKTAPVDVREKVALAPEAYAAYLHELSQLEPLRECAVLSTCNRTELYGVASFYDDGLDSLSAEIRRLGARTDIELEPYLYRLNGMDAARHLLRVASSLDSLVVGEPQILGQVKDAYRTATDESASGLVLNKLFRMAITVGKRVRTDTEIGALAVSVSSVGVGLAEKIFGSLQDRTTLVIGAGETAQQTLIHLQSAGVNRILIANRTLETAERVAKDFGARAVTLDRLGEVLAEADTVIASATSDEPILRRSDIEAAMRLRKGRPMFLIDLAVPRNIEPAAHDIYNVFLYDIDDLEKVVQGNRGRRDAEAEKAEELVEEELTRFAGWWKGLDSVPTLIQLRSRIEQIGDEESARILSKLQHLEDKDQELVKQLANSIVKKVLHHPTTQIKRSGGDERAANLAASLRYLFQLDESDGGGRKGTAEDTEPKSSGDSSEPPRQIRESNQ